MPCQDAKIVFIFFKSQNVCFVYMVLIVLGLMCMLVKIV